MKANDYKTISLTGPKPTYNNTWIYSICTRIEARLVKALAAAAMHDGCADFTPDEIGNCSIKGGVFYIFDSADIIAERPDGTIISDVKGYELPIIHGIGIILKSYWKRYCDWCDRTMDAPNPSKL